MISQCWRWTVALALLLAIGGCAPVHTTGSGDIDADELLNGGALFGNELPDSLPDVEILEVDAEMRRFLDAVVDRRAATSMRLQQLVYAVVQKSSFGLDYTEHTRTAAETFHQRNGNCLAFTSMFVALARELGLDARFQQVDIPPDWEKHGEVLVLNRHVNVLLDLGTSGQKVVDFNIEDFRSSYDRHAISDSRAYAHYYNNRGAEEMQAGRNQEAFRYLKKGIGIDQGFSPLWTNLGTLYLRGGKLHHAEASYVQALARDRADMVAISNLERVYQRLGNSDLAERYRELARYHRERNPYYRYYQAREAFLERDYAAARQHLDFAIRKKPNEDTFYFLRGLSHLQLGDSARARKDLQRAEEIATDGQLKRNYHSKIEMLLSEPR